jgi:hypothetical protein
MKNTVLAGLLFVAAAASAQAFDDKDDIRAAAKKLADAPNYSWTSTTKNNAETPGPGAGRGGPGAMEGKTEKDGVTWFSMKMGENTFETAMKGEKYAMKFKDTWMGSADAPAGGQPGRPDPSMFATRLMKNLRPVAQNVTEAIDKLKEIKSEGGGVYSGEFTPEGAKDQLAPKGGQGNTPPAVSDAKGSVKIWVKDGTIVKIESTLQGKVTMGTREIAMDRTVTTEIKDIGSTKIELPDEAKKKLE